MFQMMNAARINTGVSGMTLASSAYQNALEYVKARVQGRDIAGRKSGDVPIIDHPDVRRMLLWMKAMVEGMRSMIYTGAFWQDHALELPQGEQKQHYANLLDFMTPIIKAYYSDMGFRVCETAIQCLGGYGYCREYPLEQYLRDAKIMSLCEGTNGIQSMDLMGRKMRIPWRQRMPRCERGGRLLRCRKGRFDRQRTEVRGQRSEDRGQKTEDRRQRSEDRGQRTDDRKQRTDDRRQGSEDRGQRTDDRKQRTDDRRQGILNLEGLEFGSRNVEFGSSQNSHRHTQTHTNLF